MREFLREATLGDILEYLKESFVDSLYWWAEGAEKLATFDILSFDIPQTLVTIFFIYVGFATRGDIKDRWENFNHEVDNVAEALKSKQETDDMIQYFKRSGALFYDETYKDMSDEKLLKVLKKRFKRKKPKIYLYVNQFFHITTYYWIAVLIYIMTNYS
jgi:hypothetical protein